MRNPPRAVLVALDTADLDRAKALAGSLRGHVSGVKLGLEFFMAQGAMGVAAIGRLGLPMFLDLKFHDIPNTVAGAMAALAPLSPMMVNLHASGGRRMMLAGAQALREAADIAGAPAPKIIAVTVLTSLDDSDLAELGQLIPGLDQVRRLAALARASGLDGIVCSPHEIVALRRDQGPDFLLVTPGVRPDWAGVGDQKRVMSPGQAMREGADYLVIGRPITEAPDPVAAATRINSEIEAALARN